MYADDLVLFSESQSGLQSMLNILHKYTLEWNLEVNINKTKIIVFRNCGHVKDSEKWLYCDNEIEIVDQFNYFGFLLNYNARFHVNQQHFALQGRKAMYAIKSKTRNLFLNTETMLSLFDTYVSSVLLYSCEVYAMHEGKALEQVHFDFCKTVLGVQSSTNNAMVYFELSRLPLSVIRKLRMFKYWFNLLNSKNCILYNVYQFLLL